MPAPKRDAPWIYLAGPLFSQAELEFNLKLAQRLEAAGFRVFLPQRDGADPQLLLKQSTSSQQIRKTIFETDRDQVLKADILLFVLDGRVPDEGACFELGLAYAQKLLKPKRPKLLLGLLTDRRGAFLQSQLNPMLEVPLDNILESEEELLKLLTRFRQSETRSTE